MKNNRIKIRLWFIFLVVFSITAYLISDTYAIFETNSTIEGEFTLGKWVIKLNDIDISSSATHTFSIANFVYEDNNHTASGYIAPGMSGYFDIILDPEGTDVAVRYDITLTLSDEYEDNITFVVDADNGNTIRTAENTYSGVFDLESIQNGDTATITIHIEWENDEDYDESDTNLGIVQNNKISFPVEVHVSQYLGETIDEYIEENTEEYEEG